MSSGSPVVVRIVEKPHSEVPSGSRSEEEGGFCVHNNNNISDVLIHTLGRIEFLSFEVSLVIDNIVVGPERDTLRV